MALQLPSYSVPQPYDTSPDIVGRFQKGYQFVRDLQNEADAEKTLSQYAASLYPTGQAGKPSMSLLDLATSADPQNRMIGAEHLSAQDATDPTLASYLANMVQRESGGNPSARNPNSSATGLAQITNATWDGLMQSHPELGLTPDGRTDPAQSMAAARALTTDNIAALRKAGQPINPGTLYAAHFLGAPQATQVLGYADNTPLVSALPPEVVSANPQLQNMTVGDFKAWAAQNGGNGSGGYQPPAAPTGTSAPTANGLPPREVMAALLRNPETRQFGAQLITASRTGTGLTDVQKNYAAAVAQGYRGTLLDYQKQLKSSGVTVNTGDNSSKFTNKADELAAGRMSDYVTGGNDAANVIGDLKALTDLGKNVQTGKKTQILAALGPYAEALGVKIDGLDDAQAYNAIIDRMAPQMRAPGSGSSSDTDVRMFLNSLPSLGNTPEGNQIIINTFQGIQDRKVKAAEIANQALSGDITWQEADKRIAALGDPYTAFKKWQATQKAVDKANPSQPNNDQPPASFNEDPSLWQYLTPEQRALWQ